MKKSLKLVLLVVLVVVMALGCYLGAYASDEDDTGGCAEVQMMA